MKVLVIAPHADDEVLGCGGVIQWHKDKGDTIFANIVADRVLNHKVDFGYIEQTRQNADKVKKLLGIEKYYFSGLSDEHLDESLIKVIMPIEEVVDIVKPNIVYLPNGEDSNQDHQAVHSACQVACRGVNKLLSYEVPSSTSHFAPNYYIDIEKYLGNKIKAMSYYEGELREYPHPRSEEGMRLLAKVRGMECGRRLAEGFRLIKEVIV